MIRRVAFWTALGLFVGAAGVSALGRFGVVVLNLTASEPVGIYWSASKSGDFAQVCLTPDQWSVASRSGSNLLSGSCADGHAPILKQIYYASPTTPVQLTAEGFRQVGALHTNTAPVVYAANGVPVQHYPFGVYTSGIFAYSTYNERSYDSRYFGPIRQSQIVGYTKPLLVWR